MKKLFLLVLPLLVLGACDKAEKAQCTSGVACESCVSACEAQAGAERHEFCDCACHQVIDNGTDLVEAAQQCAKYAE